MAAEIEPTGTMSRKLQRGFLNIALSPFEISHGIVESQPFDTALPTWIAGTIKGSFKAVGRALTGGYELVTFPIPLPAHYEPILQPEFAWDLLQTPEYKLKRVSSEERKN